MSSPGSVLSSSSARASIQPLIWATSSWLSAFLKIEKPRRSNMYSSIGVGPVDVALITRSSGVNLCLFSVLGSSRKMACCSCSLRLY